MLFGFASAPLNATFRTDSEAIRAMRTHALDNGFSISLKRIKYDPKDPATAIKYWYKCDKGFNH